MKNNLAILGVRWNKFKMVIGPKVFRLLIFAAIAGLFWFLIDLSFVGIIQIFLVSLGLLEIKNTFLPAYLTHDATLGVFTLLAFGILRSVVSAVKFYISAMAGEDFIVYSRTRIMKQSLTGKRPIGSTAEIMHVFLAVVSNSSSFVQNLIAVISVAVSGTFYFGIGLYLAPKEFLVGIALFALMVWPLKMLEARHRSLSDKVGAEGQFTWSVLIQSLRNIFLLRLYGQTNAEYEKCKASIERNRNHYRVLFAVTGFKSAFPLAAGTIVIASIMWFGINVFHTQGMVLVSLFYIFLRVAQSAGDGLGSMNQIKFYFPFFKQMYRTVELEKELQTYADPVGPSMDIHEIEAKNLGFEYTAGKPVFNGINLQLKKGDILLIRGESGAGKSTLVLNLTGFLEPTQGIVLINGIDSRHLEHSVCASIGHVGPDPFVIPGTVRENMMYANPKNNISDEQIWTALKKSKADVFIEALPQKLDTFLNEETQLSTGQKQRLSLARALLRDPWLLILDEATANLDPDTECEIIEIVKAEAAQRVTFIVSHKDSFEGMATQRLQLQAMKDTGQFIQQKAY